ncbi:MAG: hypothetical protein AAGD09_11440 [Cyanobacteria bacterium P01_F01_bin.56]
MEEIKEFELGNYYGKLAIARANGKPYWSIQDDSVVGRAWKEIPESLYWELAMFHQSQQRNQWCGEEIEVDD